MMASLFAGVSGLRNHQVKMNVIGDNIANVNTIGFKTGASHEASLQTQDVLRWLIILAIFGGIVLKFLGIGF